MSTKFTLPNKVIGPEANASVVDWSRTSSGEELGISVAETTQRFVYGTRYVTWDGRVYKYMGLTTGGCVSYHGVASTAEAALSYTVNPLATSIGGTSITATVDTITEDQFSGGFAYIYKAIGENSIIRQIVGNDATSGTTTKFYLERPLEVATTTSDYHEIYANPYRLVSGSTNSTAAWMGVPTVTAATGYNVWVQTWGPALISPGNTTLDDAAADERTVFWLGNGTLAEVGGTPTAGENQVAGYILNAGTGDIAGPMIYLMCST